MAAFDDLRLETPRLILRPPRLDDLDAWTEMMQDEPTARFIGGVMPRPVCWRAADDDGRRLARSGLRDVLGG